jgi:hypothetical protein
MTENETGEQVKFQPLKRILIWKSKEFWPNTRRESIKAFSSRTVPQVFHSQQKYFQKITLNSVLTLMNPK